MRTLIALALGLALLAPPAAHAAGERERTAREELSARPPAPGERTVLGRLIAPCCWQQTLDVHESELTRDLRMEVRGRLYAGETPAAVEESLVARYGERMRAAPTRDPMRNVALGLLVAVAVAGVGMTRVLRRWRERSEGVAAAPANAAPAPAARDAYDDRLDDELQQMD